MDQSLIDSCAYLVNTLRNFRKRLETFMSIQQGKKSQSKEKEPGSHRPLRATIYVARTYPKWQTFVIDQLKEIYAKHDSFPENNVLFARFKDRPEIDSKYAKKLMPFIGYCQKLVKEASGSIDALTEHMTFDEYDVLATNQAYIQRSLKLDGLEIKLIREDDTSDSLISVDNADDIVPGK